MNEKEIQNIVFSFLNEPYETCWCSKHIFFDIYLFHMSKVSNELVNLCVFLLSLNDRS